MASTPLPSPTGSIHKSICIDRGRVSSCCNRPLQPGLYRQKPSPSKAKADAAEGLRPDIESSVMAQLSHTPGLVLVSTRGMALHPSAILDTRPSRFCLWDKAPPLNLHTKAKFLSTKPMGLLWASLLTSQLESEPSQWAWNPCQPTHALSGSRN